MIKYPVCILLLFYCMSFTILYAQNADVNLLRSINKNETNFKNKYLELNASSVRVLSAGVPVGIAIAGFIKHDKPLQRDAFYMGGAYIFSAIVIQSSKRIINRQRPFDKYSFVIKRDDESGGYSFPSGHTADAFCMATSVALRYHKWYFIAPSYLFATSVAWARVYQGVHYPSDVLGGAVVGTCSALLGWKLQKWMNNRKNKPVAIINQRW
jgi:membrane-associated phospholipid phosphatase